MRRFVLERDVDHTGASGTGRVVEGVEFSDGRVALRWLTGRASTATYDSIADVEAIHGHDGDTRVVWLGDGAPVGGPPPAPGTEFTGKLFVNGRPVPFTGEAVAMTLAPPGGVTIRFNTTPQWELEDGHVLLVRPTDEGLVHVHVPVVAFNHPGHGFVTGAASVVRPRPSSPEWSWMGLLIDPGTGVCEICLAPPPVVVP